MSDDGPPEDAGAKPNGHDPERADAPLLSPEVQQALSLHIHNTVQSVIAIRPGHLEALRREIEREERRTMIANPKLHARMATAQRKAMRTIDALAAFRKEIVEIIQGPTIVAPDAGLPERPV